MQNLKMGHVNKTYRAIAGVFTNLGYYPYIKLWIKHKWTSSYDLKENILLYQRKNLRLQKANTVVKADLGWEFCGN